MMEVFLILGKVTQATHILISRAAQICAWPAKQNTILFIKKVSQFSDVKVFLSFLNNKTETHQSSLSFVNKKKFKPMSNISIRIDNFAANLCRKM